MADQTVIFTDNKTCRYAFSYFTLNVKDVVKSCYIFIVEERGGAYLASTALIYVNALVRKATKGNFARLFNAYHV